MTFCATTLVHRHPKIIAAANGYDILPMLSYSILNSKRDIQNIRTILSETTMAPIDSETNFSL